MPIANYTTKVPVSRSVMLIQEILSANGAMAIMMDYEAGDPCAVTFRIDKGDHQLGFRLPCDWKKTLAVLNRSKIPSFFKRNDQAKRVAWRCVHDWIRAQLALVEIGAVELDQVMLPYLITNNGLTLYERISSNGLNQIGF